ncbi:MAG: glycosyltransferase [Candidatus Cloacimonetes bacterium]|nr:glycosyltransferase [Candidatus Cloacimonadota bacterium]
MNLPKVSVVIPTYNSERTLGMCLESIRKQGYPRNKIEIIIGDGGSTDRTLENTP